jgi:predicted RNase H-like nuclease (RuvC/YqgF family)
LDIVNEISAKVMGDILAKGMSLSKVDLSETVNSEAVRALGEIKKALSEEKNGEKKLERVEKIINEYKREDLA